MPSPVRLLSELRQRRVYRAGAIYAAVAWVIWQGAEIAVPALRRSFHTGPREATAEASHDSRG